MVNKGWTDIKKKHEWNYFHIVYFGLLLFPLVGIYLQQIPLWQFLEAHDMFNKCLWTIFLDSVGHCHLCSLLMPHFTSLGFPCIYWVVRELFWTLLLCSTRSTRQLFLQLNMLGTLEFSSCQNSNILSYSVKENVSPHFLLYRAKTVNKIMLCGVLINTSNSF